MVDFAVLFWSIVYFRYTCIVLRFTHMCTHVVDPVQICDMFFSSGSRISRRGALNLVGGLWTPKVVMFRKFCMSKRKNLDPWGACAGYAPLDPPMFFYVTLVVLHLNAHPVDPA